MTERVSFCLLGEISEEYDTSDLDIRRSKPGYLFDSSATAVMGFRMIAARCANSDLCLLPFEKDLVCPCKAGSLRKVFAQLGGLRSHGGTPSHHPLK